MQQAIEFTELVGDETTEYCVTAPDYDDFCSEDVLEVLEAAEGIHDETGLPVIGDNPRVGGFDYLFKAQPKNKLH